MTVLEDSFNYLLKTGEAYFYLFAVQVRRNAHLNPSFLSCALKSRATIAAHRGKSIGENRTTSRVGLGSNLPSGL